MNTRLHTALRLLVLLMLTLVLIWRWTTVARAAGPGDLDPSFNGTGVVTTSINSSNQDIAYSVVIQPDGKIVAAGESRANGATGSLGIVRYNEAGSLDTTFNGSGVVTTPIGSRTVGLAVTLQENKIVVAGRSEIGNTPMFAVVRYNEVGSLDTSFNGTGIVTTSIGAGAGGSAVALQGDKIVVAGNSLSSGNSVFTVVRYNSNGSLDAGFGGTGIVTTTIGTASAANAVAIQPDGKIVAAGRSSSNGFDLTVIRYNDDGSLDKTFNGSGILTASVGTDVDTATAIVIQPPDNKIVVVGQSYNFTNPKFVAMRYTSDGKLDTTFNGTGIITTSIGSHALAFSAVSQKNGKIVVAGSSSDGQGPRFTLARYTQDGKLDPTFNQTGIVTTDIGSKPSEAFSIAIQPDGKLVVAGFTYDFDFALARYLGDPINVFYLPTILKNR